MTRRVLLLAGLAAICFAANPAPKKPKLLVAIVVDQFRYDYLARFGAEYKAGLAELLANGAVFTNANYEHFPTVTAVGHSTVLSGATPSLSGIVGNEWFDRASGKNVTSVSDDGTALVGVPGERRGASPRRMLVSTVGDEIKMANGSRTKVIGISAKDRAAILPAGRMANAAYWFDSEAGNFVTSTYYVPQMPGWAATFNSSRAADQWAGKPWIASDGSTVLRKLAATPGKSYYDALERTPYHDELLGQFAAAAIEGEQLGTHDGTDVLTVSFSAHDRVGHAVGPYSEEVHSLALRTDQTIGRLLKIARDKVGADNLVVAFTADHGVAPMPEYMHERKMPGGRMTAESVRRSVQAALVAKYGEGRWVVGYSGPAPYLNRELIEQKKLNYEEVQNVAAEAVRSIPEIFRVYTRQQLMLGLTLDDMVDRRVRNGFNAERSSDLFIVAEPYFLFEAGGTSHGTPWSYDAHVPLILMGPGVKAGRYHKAVAINDLAPTLATMLNVETPSGSAGRVLDEALVRPSTTEVIVSPRRQ